MLGATTALLTATQWRSLLLANIVLATGGPPYAAGYARVTWKDGKLIIHLSPS